MCGIAGIIHINGNPIDANALQACTDALAHRGPNASGFFISNNVGLGHRRLSVIDLNVSANQPFLSDDKQVALVFNGEIYNFKELKKDLQLKGHSFKTNSDTEVLLHLYLEEGKDCIHKLRGMFAFCIYDKRNNTIFVARDRTGQKPLKYFYTNGTFAFASELKALHTIPECPKEIDEQSIYDYLTLMYVPAPHTGWTNIHTLPAAHFAVLQLDTGDLQLQRYWQLSYETNHKKSISDWKESTLALLQEATALRTIADVPIGAFLSGGIDSGMIVALLSKLQQEPVHTFSIGSNDKKMNELPAAALVADRYATDHTELPLEADIVTLLPELVKAYDCPFADPSSIPTYKLCQETSKHVTVALSGDGGDENFIGYSRYPIAQFARRYERLSKILHHVATLGTSTLHTINPTTFSYRCKRFQTSMPLPQRQRYLQYLSFFTEEEKKQIWKNTQQPTDERYAQQFTKEIQTNVGIEQDVAADFLTYLPEDLLPKVDIASMAFGLEVRAPFLDHKLLEHTAAMPVALKLRGNTTKWILKELAKDLLPTEIVHAKKRGFRLPLNIWFRNDLKEYVYDNLLATNAPLHAYCKPAGIRSLLDEYNKTKIDYSDHIWSLLWLNEWLKLHTTYA